MYEYKFIPTPLQTCRGEQLKNDRKAMAGSLASEATLLSASGWDFVRFDRVPVTRRRFIIFSAAGERTVTVYRRQIRDSDAATLPVLANQPKETSLPKATAEAQAVRPRRLSRQQKRGIPEFLIVPGPAGDGAARLG